MAENGSFFGRAFGAVGPRMDRRGALEHRRQLVGQAHGAVVEVGAGYGATFLLYPPSVSRVLALEPEPGLRVAAERAAAGTTVPIQVKDGRVESIPVGAGTVDAVVSSLVLCSVENQAVALAEIVRVLKPGGLLLFYEHVRSSHHTLAALEDLGTPLWRRVAGGCHPNRDTTQAIVSSGLLIESSTRFGFSVLPGVPNVDHVIGAARKPNA